MSVISSPEAVRFSDWNYEGLSEPTPSNSPDEEIHIHMDAIPVSQAADYEYVEARRFAGNFHGIQRGYTAQVAEGINWFVSGRKFSRLAPSELLYYDLSFDEVAAPLKTSYRIR